MLTDIRGKVLKNIMGHKNLNLDKQSLNRDDPVSSTDSFLSQAWLKKTVPPEKLEMLKDELIREGLSQEDADRILVTEIRKKYGKQLSDYVNK